METNILRAKVGQPVKTFQAEAYMPDGSFQVVDLQTPLDAGKWVIVFFWPLDFTTICPTEIRAMSDAIRKFEREDAVILGISTDSIESHRAWCNLSVEEKGLGKINFPMLADSNHEISRYFDVLIEDKGIALRGTFIISPDGIVQSAVINNLDVGRNVDEILRTLAAFQTGGMCGVNWHEGDDNL